MSLKGKVAIVSGGSRGIGKAVTLDLAGKGANVIFLYRQNTAEADSVMKSADGMEGKVCAVKADIENAEEVRRTVKKIAADWGTVDILINNAGIRRDRTIAFLSEEDWKDVIDTNVSGLFYLTQSAIYYMLKSRRGRIVNISSVSGIDGIAGQTNYSASKAAVIGFSRALAKEVAPFGVRVNVIAPGGVQTDMTENMNSKGREKLLEAVPVKRFCKPEEVARLAAFLADEEGSPDYLTGSVIALDGGMGH